MKEQLNKGNKKDKTPPEREIVIGDSCKKSEMSDDNFSRCPNHDPNQAYHLISPFSSGDERADNLTEKNIAELDLDDERHGLNIDNEEICETM